MHALLRIFRLHTNVLLLANFHAQGVYILHSIERQNARKVERLLAQPPVFTFRLNNF